MHKAARLVIEFIFHLVISSFLILVIYISSVTSYNNIQIEIYATTDDGFHTSPGLSLEMPPSCVPIPAHRV